MLLHLLAMNSRRSSRVITEKCKKTKDIAEFEKIIAPDPEWGDGGYAVIHHSMNSFSSA